VGELEVEKEQRELGGGKEGAVENTANSDELRDISLAVRERRRCDLR